MNTFSLSQIQEFLTLQNQSVSLVGLVLDSLLLVAMVLVVSWLYVKTARTLSNRKRLAALLPLLSLTTMMIILIVKSSLALSLGLVGALSIVRFRSAIKDPEELAFIFLAIGLGLGIGAQQRVVTGLLFLIIAGFIVLESMARGRFQLLDIASDQRLFLSLKSKKPLDLKKIVPILEKHTHFLELKRLDAQDKQHEVLFALKMHDYQQVANLKADLLAVYKKADLVLLNDEALFA